MGIRLFDAKLFTNRMVTWVTWEENSAAERDSLSAFSILNLLLADFFFNSSNRWLRSLIPSMADWVFFSAFVLPVSIYSFI